jgi:hypothetical protein
MKSLRIPSHARWLRFAVIMLAVGVIAACAWLSFTWFASHDRLVVWDFQSPWLALRAMLRDGLNPYSDQVTLSIQQASYGRAAYTYEDQRAMAYPLSIMVLMGPLTALPLPVAQAVWFVLLEASLLTFLAVAPRAVGWRPPGWLLVLTILFTLGLYPDVWAMILGQVSIVVAVLVALAWWGMRIERWTLAGVCLGLATIKPQMTFLFVPAVIIWALYQRRWRVVMSFAVTMGVILLLPMLWVPGWPLAWAQQSERYVGSTVFEPAATALTGSVGANWLVAALLSAWLAFWWWRNRRQPDMALGWAPSMLVAIGGLVAPRTSQANQLVLLLPLFFVFGRLRRQWMIAGVEVVLLVGLWLIAVLMLPAASDPQHTLWEHRLISPILPIGLTAALLAMTPLRWREAAA